MLKLSDISLNFGGLQVLKNVNLQVPQGSIYGLIGPNGAGKTTLFNLITGLIEPNSGSILFEDQTILKKAPHYIARLGLSRTFQNIRLFKDLTLLENVVIGTHKQTNYSSIAMLLNLTAFRQQESASKERALELLEWLNLADKAHDLSDNLSYGEQRRLEIARALATEPKLLLLDEPAAGMNTGERADLMEKIKQISERGYTILMIEHDMHFVMGLCEHITVLNFGQVIASGAPKDIQSDKAVIEAYLGRDDEDD